jgi:flagellar motor component MotA
MNMLVDYTSLVFVIASIFSIILATGVNANGRATLLTSLPELAFIGMYIGLVIMLGNMNDPADVPISLAICCLPALYAFIVYLVTVSTNVNTEIEKIQPRTKQRAAGTVIFLMVLIYVTSVNHPAFLDSFTVVAVSILVFLVAVIQKMSGGFSSIKTRDLLPTIGMIVGVIGSIVALANIYDPKSIGPAMAVAYLGVIYTSVIRVLWLILQPTNETEESYERVVHFAYGRFLLPIITVTVLLVAFQLQQ